MHRRLVDSRHRSVVCERQVEVRQRIIARLVVSSLMIRWQPHMTATNQNNKYNKCDHTRTSDRFVVLDCRRLVSPSRLCATKSATSVHSEASTSDRMTGNVVERD